MHPPNNKKAHEPATARRKSALIAGLPDFSYQNDNKIYQCHIIYENDSKIDQMAIKFANIFHCKALQNLPKLGFFYLKKYHLATLSC
jgi:hypothetical protein